MRRWLAIALGLAVLFAVFGSLYSSRAAYEGDPDRYYHMALSRQTVEAGRLFLRAVPQVEGLGWNDLFVDKEFLFHQATSLGYRIAGDKGVELASSSCALLAVLVFFLFAVRRMPLYGAVGLTLLTFSSPYLAFRMALLRPHTLAVLTFLLMSISVLSRRPYFTAVTAFLFALSYHAFYVPLLCMGAVFALSYLDRRNEGEAWRRVSFFGIAGCVAGLLANPYFPGNIVLALIHARIPDLMKGELKGASFGDELMPLRSDQYFLVFSGPLLVLFLAGLLLGLDLARSDERARAARVKLLYLLAVGGFFLVLTFQIARAGEYLVPVCGLILAVLLERWDRFRKPASALMLVLAIAQAWGMGRYFRGQQASFVMSPSRVAETFDAIAAIPAEPKGAKVYNCEWDRTPYIFYKRPDLRFVDILDPSLLYFSDAGAYRARLELEKGMVADAWGLIRGAFKADYVFCNDLAISAQLRSDPGFRQIYPKVQFASQSYITPTLFRVLPERGRDFATELLVSEPRSYDNAGLFAAKPPEPSAGRRELELDRSPYQNLTAYLQPKFSGYDATCSFVAPTAAELKRFAGSELLGLGGGPGIKAWRNGRPLFTTRAGFVTTREVQVLVPLSPPLRAGDRVEVMLCANALSPFWGVSLSFWTRDRARKFCEDKRSELKAAAVDPAEWPFEGLQLLTCLGPVAAQEPSRALGAPAK